MIKRLLASVFAVVWLASAPVMAQNKITASQELGAPGVYEVTTAGITVTLPSYAGSLPAQPIVIKDATGNASPNITISAPIGGTIDGLSSIVISTPNQGMLFEPFQNGFVWVVGGVYNAVSGGANAGAAGSVGEVISSDIPTASAISQPSSGTAINVTSVSLTPGDWDCTGSVVTKPTGSTTTSAIAAGISTVTATLPAAIENGETTFQAPQAAAIQVAVPLSRVVELVSTSTPVYLVGNSTFAVSTMSLYGQIICRRMR